MKLEEMIANSIRKSLSEVELPRSRNERKFMDQHTIEFYPHPVALDSQFTGTIQKDTSRIADYQPGEDEAAYDLAYESVDLQELSRYTLKSYINSAKYNKDNHDVDAKNGNKNSKRKSANRSTGIKKAISKADQKLYPGSKQDPRDHNGYYDESVDLQEHLKKSSKYINHANKRLSESFAPGELRFKNGTKTTVKESDASLLNNFYSSLGSIQQKEMKEHISESLANYKAVLEFALIAKGR